MEDSMATPVRNSLGSMLNTSISSTPNPQATSTVARHVNYDDLLSYSTLSCGSDKPNFLSAPIDDLKTMSNKLEALNNSNSDSENVAPQRRTTRMSSRESFASRRSSARAESLGNSSLGILNFNEMDCDGLNTSTTSSLYAGMKVNNETFPAEETFDWRGFSSRSVLSENNHGSPSLSMLNSNAATPSDSAADLRLRMQKALAQRAIKRAAEKSQNMANHEKVDHVPSSPQDILDSFKSPESWGSVGSAGDLVKSKLRESVTSVNEELNSPVLSFTPRSSVIQDLSKESFLSGELALDRIENDQQSWYRKYGTLPNITTEADDRLSTASSRATNVTQTLDRSLSGIISGDITVSSFLDANVDKKRISAGEYFGLRSEHIGNFDVNSPVPPPESERPNFGHEIHSPTRIRRMPLVANAELCEERPSGENRLSDISLDKVPTKDTGLGERQTMDTLDFTFNSSEATGRNSAELMPPPPPPQTEKYTQNVHESYRSKSRRSLQVAPNVETSNQTSKRLSMSLSDITSNAAAEAADTSYMSVDEAGRRVSNQTVASLSHIAQLLSDMSGHMSTRLVIDNLLDGRNIGSSSRSTPTPAPTPRSNRSGEGSKSDGDTRLKDRSTDRDHTDPHLGSHDVTRTQSSTRSAESNKGRKSGGNAVCGAKETPAVENADWSLSVKERVNEWMSRSDLNSERQHIRDEINTERMLAANSPAKETSTPRESMYSDISSAGLSELGQLNRSSPKASDMPKSGCNSDSGCHKAPTTSTCIGGPTVKSTLLSQSAPVGDRQEFVPHGSNQDIRSQVSKSASSLSSQNGADTSSLSTSSPFQVDSTHTQLSWPSVPLGSSKTQSFALRNKSNGRVRLLVVSGNPAFKLLGERGEGLSELTVSMHSEEARRIHVVFSPVVCGPLASRLVISRVGGSEADQRKERRLIPLYAMGGQAQVILEGAPKDQWSQCFVNLTYVDGDLSGATFCARNTGDVPAFVHARISSEGIPFSECGVSISPESCTLTSGQSVRFSLRWDPSVEVLEWLAANSGDVHVLANVWLSWAELSTWQRITRLYRKYYQNDNTGLLAQWTPCVIKTTDGGKEPCVELKDNKGAEGSLVQSVRRIKLAVLGERDMLRGFDLDASVVFQQLTVNETVMMNSPLDDERRNESTPYLSSPETHDESPRERLHGSRHADQTGMNADRTGMNTGRAGLNADLDVTRTPVRSDSYVVGFPPTVLTHKTCAKIIFKNFSTEKHNVMVRGVTEPFSVPTSRFVINGDWYVSLRVFFQPKKIGRFDRLIEIWVDDQYKLCYQLIGEGITESDS